MAGIRAGLLGEIVVMSFDTLRTNKMRSALTVLGVVIGITSIVGMTSLIRGFDESLRDSIRELGPNTIIVQKFGALSFAAGKSFLELTRRPNLTIADARAIERDCPSVGAGRRVAGRAWAATAARACTTATSGPSRSACSARPRTSPRSTSSKIEAGRFFIPAEVEHRRQVVVLGQQPVAVALPEHRSDRQEGPRRREQYTVIGVLGKRPSPGGFDAAPTTSCVIPYSDARESSARSSRVRRRSAPAASTRRCSAPR